MRYTKNQGSAVVVIAIVVSVVVVGVLGYAVWNNFIATDDTDTQNTSVTTDSYVDNDASNQDSTDDLNVANWTLYNTDQFSLPIPDGWKLQEFIDGDGNRMGTLIQREDLSFADALTYKDGTRATIDTVVMEGGRGYTVNFAVTFSSEGRTISPSEEGYEKVANLETATGDLVEKYHMFHETESGGVHAYYPAGSHVYNYIVNMGDVFVDILYQINPNEQPDNIPQLEAALRAMKSK